MSNHIARTWDYKKNKPFGSKLLPLSHYINGSSFPFLSFPFLNFTSDGFFFFFFFFLRLLGKKGPRMGLCPSQWVYVGACPFGILYQKGVLVTVLFCMVVFASAYFSFLTFFSFPCNLFLLPHYFDGEKFGKMFPWVKFASRRCK